MAQGSAHKPNNATRALVASRKAQGYTNEEIAKQEGVDTERFLALFTSQAMKEKTEADVYRSRSMGANVFPSVVLIDDEGHLCVIKGYRSYEEIQRLID